MTEEDFRYLVAETLRARDWTDVVVREAFAPYGNLSVRAMRRGRGFRWTATVLGRFTPLKAERMAAEFERLALADR